MPDEELLRQVARASERVKKADASLIGARQELREAIRAAHTGGWSYARIASVLGISRQRVAELAR